MENQEFNNTEGKHINRLMFILLIGGLIFLVGIASILIYWKVNGSFVREDNSKENENNGGLEENNILVQEYTVPIYEQYSKESPKITLLINNLSGVTVDLETKEFPVVSYQSAKLTFSTPYEQFPFTINTYEQIDSGLEENMYRVVEKEGNRILYVSWISESEEECNGAFDFLGYAVEAPCAKSLPVLMICQTPEKISSCDQVIKNLSYK